MIYSITHLCDCVMRNPNVKCWRGVGLFDEGGGGYCVLVFLCFCFTRDRKQWATWEGDGTHEVLVS